MTLVPALSYAFTLGMVAAVNPCGFPLLPAYLAGFLATEHRLPWAQRTGRALFAGACVTAGFVLTFGLSGVVISMGMSFTGDWVPWLMIALGVGVAGIGVCGLLGRPITLRMPVVRFRTGSGALAMAGFGSAYAIGSLSCTLPLFLTAVSGAFTRAGTALGMLAFVAYALGMGAFVIAATLITAQFGVGSFRALRALTRFVPLVASALVTACGLYLAYYWVADLVGSLPATPLSIAVEGLQAAVVGLLGTPSAVMACLGVIILGAMLTLWRNKGKEKTENA